MAYGKIRLCRIFEETTWQVAMRHARTGRKVFPSNPSHL
jgi:hypothetical protein